MGEDVPGSIGGKPLAVILSPLGDHTAAAGSTLELSVAVFNRGGQNAILHIYLSDPSETVNRWCTSPFERLAIGPGQSSDVLFRLQVPTQTLPGTYPYQVIVDAPQHYPEDTPIQYNQRLQVLPQVESVVQVSDPTFTLEPITTSLQPAVLQPGGSLDVRVQVYNRSNRVDRFRLSCPDLDHRWFKVIYPQGLLTPGLISSGSGLELNPGDRGEILLRLSPPPEALAGSYTPTLRLYSTNQPQLALLDAFYLEVTPIDLMQVELQTLIGKVRQTVGLYRVQLTNRGNTPRELLLGAHSVEEEESRLCQYRWADPENARADWLPVRSTGTDGPPVTLSPLIPILPGQSIGVDLEVKPTRASRRPWLGNGRIFNFRVDLKDPQQRPLPLEYLQGSLLWRARPFWQFLLLLLTALGAIGALAFLIWWLFFRPPLPSRVLELTAGDLAYEELNGKPVRLNWQISNPKRIGKLRLVGLSTEDGTVLSQPVVYDFSQGLPNPLKPFCTLDRVLTCRYVPTDAHRTGSYVFELQVQPRKENASPLDTAKTNPIKISPLPLPKILELGPTEPIYQEPANPVANSTDGQILLNWKVANPGLLQEVQLIGRSPDNTVVVPLQRFDFSSGVPSTLQSFCVIQTALVCRKVPIEARKPGDYIFELLVTSRTAPEEPVANRKTDTVRIKPQQVPIQIVKFLINGQPAEPRLVLLVQPDQPPPPLQISWEVTGGRGLKVTLLPAPGTVGLSGTVPYSLSTQPRQETLTLQVTNEMGEQVTRSVTIETVNPPAQPQVSPEQMAPAPGSQPAFSPTDPTGSAGFGSPASQPGVAPGATSAPSPGSDLQGPVPVQPGTLSPVDVPPQFDR
ncbi:hypothetical protein BST81_01730 [Leptolyngbya sp. 'hensonii']|nr:hypothetical protein BST81_01730 [Leptolyngbya sp. 'hensonii']